MTHFFSMKKLATGLTLVLVLLLFPYAVRSQTGNLTYRDSNYVLGLPSAKWRAISVSGVAQDSTEFRYGDQGLVQMRIRRQIVDAGVSPTDLLLRQQSSDRVFLRGYVKGQQEIFQGRLSGVKYPYEYVSGGQPVAGLIYYLQADNRTIYRIEFIGPPEELLSMGDQTDYIARSFRLK